jgi:hypothetical protein
MAKGHGIPADCELKGRSIYDIAPTILEWAGVVAPSHFEGRPLTHVTVAMSARAVHHV